MNKLNIFNKKMDKVYFILFILMVLSIPWIIITTTIKYGVTSQEFIVYLIVYPLMTIYLIHSFFILICSFEITPNLVKIKFLSKILAIEALEKVIFYDAGENIGGGCNIFVEIDDKPYEMILTKEEYFQFKFFAKNNNIKFLYKEDFMAKHKK